MSADSISLDEYQKCMSIFIKLIKEANLSYQDINYLLQITNKDTLNARTDLTYKPYIEITSADVHQLNSNDLEALLAHEIGHAKYGKNKVFEIITLIEGLICIYIASIPGLSLLIFLFSFILGFHLVGVTIGYLLLIGLILGIFCVILYLTNIHIKEYKADKIGVKLVGKQKYIHMLETLKNDDKNRLAQAWNMTKQLWSQPKAFLASLGLLLSCLIVNCYHPIHSTWNARIRRVRKY